MGNVENDRGRVKPYQDLFQKDKKEFTRWVGESIRNVKKKEEIEPLLSLFQGLIEEICEIAPFQAANLNRFFQTLIRFRYFKQLCDLSDILEPIANPKTIDELTELLKVRDLNRCINTVDIYKIKKIVFSQGEKQKKSDITIQLSVELEDPDLEWNDNPEIDA